MIILLPFLDGTALLPETVRALHPQPEDTVIAVLDHCRLIEEAPDGLTVLTNRLPYGKGSCIKTALSYILDRNLPDEQLMIWMDGHLPAEDTLEQVREQLTAHPQALISGAVPGRYETYPLPRQLGYKLSRAAFAFAAGTRIGDLAPALVACSTAHLAQMLALSGDGQSYITHLLISFAQEKVPLIELALTPAPGNAAPPAIFYGFWRAYFPVMMYATSSFVSFLTEYLVFLLLVGLTSGASSEELALTFNTVTARVLSCFLNFTLNRRFVFKNNDPLWPAVFKYATVAGSVLLLHVLFMQLLVSIIGLPEAVAFPISEIVLFTVGGVLQRLFVFPHDTIRHS